MLNTHSQNFRTHKHRHSHTHINTQTHLYIYIYIYIYINTHINSYTHINTQTQHKQTHVQTHTNMHTYTRVPKRTYNQVFTDRNKQQGWKSVKKICTRGEEIVLKEMIQEITVEIRMYFLSIHL